MYKILVYAENDENFAIEHNNLNEANKQAEELYNNNKNDYIVVCEVRPNKLFNDNSMFDSNHVI